MRGATMMTESNERSNVRSSEKEKQRDEDVLKRGTIST